MTLTATHNAARPVEARMLAAADRLFIEFDDLPVIDVFRAIGGARRDLRTEDGMAIPEQVERLAREQLVARRATA
jgi:hypothetical protein